MFTRPYVCVVWYSAALSYVILLHISLWQMRMSAWGAGGGFTRATRSTRHLFHSFLWRVVRVVRVARTTSIPRPPPLRRRSSGRQ